jgi:hypothetical protein
VLDLAFLVPTRELAPTGVLKNCPQISHVRGFCLSLQARDFFGEAFRPLSTACQQLIGGTKNVSPGFAGAAVIGRHARRRLLKR